MQNAQINGENFSLRGDGLEILMEKSDPHDFGCSGLSSIREIHAAGNATFESQSHSGKADKISIFPSTKILVLENNAEITSVDEGTVRGEILILDRANNRIKTEKISSERFTISVDGVAKSKLSTNAAPTEINRQME
jgi:lipopolysaccharide export system protein LptA